MTKTCVVCKKQPIPQDNTRSFHKFPIKAESKQKWLDATGLSSITINSTICSDHFSENSYHQTDGYTTLRRLLPNAVPSGLTKTTVLSDITNNIKPSSVMDSTDKSNTCDESLYCNKPSHNIESNTTYNNIKPSSVMDSTDKSNTCDEPLYCNKPSYNIESNQNEKHEDSISIDNTSSNNGSLKRKRSISDKNNTFLTRKKFRFMDGPKVNYISRNDFVSHESWSRFLKFVTYKNFKNSVAQKKYLMLFKENIVDYFLSYKLSQDHVEMFFALIRRMNGFTNNPTTIQFQSAYKKLLLNNINVTVPSSANCIPQDNTLLISDATENCVEENVELLIEKSNEVNAMQKKKKKRVKKERFTKSDIFPVHAFLHRNCNLLDHDYSKNDVWVQSDYLEQIIKHTAGSVIYSIKKKIHCKQCLDMLDGVISIRSKLTELKNRGGLNYASDDVNLICNFAEKILRRYKDSLVSANINFKLVTETLKLLPSSVFNNNSHFLEQEPLYDHRQQLIILIIQNYIDKRMQHESDKLNDIKYRVRMFYNKLTLFRGE